jgi:hypothetical protein
LADEALGDLDALQPSCTTASSARYRCSMTLSSTSTAYLPASAKGPGQADEPGHECQASAGATVKDQPEPVSKMSRNSVNHEGGAEVWN